jgi:trehalose 6-phosphate phosphatase
MTNHPSELSIRQEPASGARRPHWETTMPRLTAIARNPRFGLFTDFDGTLCYFRPFPEMPHLTDRNRAAITAISQRIPLVSIISGRAAIELRDVAELPGVKVAYVGNHGLEELQGDEVIVIPEAREWEGPMTAFYQELGEPTIPGVRYQHKRITMSVTYRGAPNPAEVRLQVKEKLDQVNQKYGFHLHEGRTIWEVKPPIPLHKGTAIRSLIEEYKLDSAIYLGDDITDIPALETIRALRDAGRIDGLAVSVLGETVIDEVIEAGDVIANSVDDVENVLEFIVRALETAPGSTNG